MRVLEAFNKRGYNNKMAEGINPKHWGKILWNIIHVSTLHITNRGKSEAASKNDARLFLSLIRVLPKGLPCRVCQEHAKTYLRSPIIQRRIGKWTSLQGDELKAEIVHFFWEFHNAVNRIKDAPFYELESMVSQYNNDDAVKAARE